jgi:amidase
MDELIYQSAARLARAIRDRELSSAEAIDGCLGRIEAMNPALNAVVAISASARAEAQAADAALARGESRGPLHGVPVTIKDCYLTAGLTSTGGTLGRADYVPEQDATAVARLRTAGAIVLGKTNCPEFCLAYETDNLVYGRSNNPYDLARVPGGSSGGEAATIAAGGSPLGLGTDGGGSIRLPSHFCGIAGIKPTTGRVPVTGIFPAWAGILEPTNAAGPMARRVEDLILALPIVAGPDGRDPLAIGMPLGAPAAVRLDGLRVAMHTDNGVVAPTPETIAAVEVAAKALAEAGCQVEQAAPAALAEAPDLFMGIYCIDEAQLYRDYLEEAGTRHPHPMLAGALELFSQQPMNGKQAARLLLRWGAYRKAMLAFMQDYDAILCPVNAHPALPHGTTFEKIMGFSYTFAFNLTGWPGAVVRAGTAPGGLPIGVQVVAPAWREDIALALAARIEAATGGWQPPPL